VILSPTAAREFSSKELYISRDNDGIYYANYFRSLIWKSAPPGDSFTVDLKHWFEDVVAIIGAALQRHEREGRLNELAKWTWFAKRFEIAAREMKDALAAAGIQVEIIKWKT
jgi:hypothetical protein